MTDDNKNLYLAIALSILFIVGWNFFYGLPKLHQPREAAQQAQVAANGAQPPGTTVNPIAPSGAATTPAGVATTAAVDRSRQDVLKDSPRVALETPSLAGSINLKGGRIDDVSLKDYRETVAPDSPIIDLLSPSGSPHPFYVETGFVGQPGATTPMPNANTVWTADKAKLTPAEPVTLTYDNGQGLVFRRTLAVDDKYMFTVADSVENKTAAPVTLFPYGLVSRHGKPVTSGYAVLHEGLIGVVGDSGVQEIKYDAIAKEANGTKLMDGTGGWIGFTDKYWAAAVVPDQSQPYKGRFSVTGQDEPKNYQTDILDDAKTVAPGAIGTVTSRVFAGAKEVNTINAYQSNLGIKKFDLLIDWGWFYFITKPLFSVIDYFFKLTGNFGIAILITTILLKGIFFPLANKSYMSMAKMKKVQPQMAAIKERFPDDRAKQQQATMELYKSEKINPVSGCLPMLIQIPIFFSLYKVIFITIEMRQAPFFGWIRDLSAPDPTSIFNLFGLIPFTPPHILAIGAWPIIMGFTMFLQMKMQPEPPDPVQKTMFNWMPVIFTYTLSAFPSGLVIYYSWNNLLTVLQQLLIAKRAGAKIELWDNLGGLFRKKPA
ncbi:membrane protein insertase YidC [Lichenihabitans sp. Uapishka_5]|uniref:membrane protein insertase YidC n=1 Tax=Lichenihabitans sp. Uapishka_5 TaxID=3037302 RepID=UPI0029E80564|nr:membrane protein insertase YidC [Lichenihabitans sp. Uapishka_5]MDX7950671.1 membrane protein insertase YidC [Lichenihabitans sp. Uapishka_5]